MVIFFLRLLFMSAGIRACSCESRACQPSTETEPDVAGDIEIHYVSDDPIPGKRDCGSIKLKKPN